MNKWMKEHSAVYRILTARSPKDWKVVKEDLGHIRRGAVYILTFGRVILK